MPGEFDSLIKAMLHLEGLARLAGSPYKLNRSVSHWFTLDHMALATHVNNSRKIESTRKI